MKRFGIACMVAGIVIMVGASGALEADTYTLWQAVRWVMAGCVIALAGDKLRQIGDRR